MHGSKTGRLNRLDFVGVLRARTGKSMGVKGGMERKTQHEIIRIGKLSRVGFEKVQRQLSAIFEGHYSEDSL